MAVDGNKVQIVLAVKDEATGALTEAEKRFAGTIGGMKQSASGLDSVMSGLKGTLAAVGLTAGVAGFAAMGKEIFEAGVRADTLDKTFKAITGSATGAKGQIAFLRAESERLGLNFISAAEAYKGLLAAARDTTITDQQTKLIFTSIAEGSTALGLSADQTQGALLALTQMLSKGKVQAEELRGQLGERLPGAFQIAAKAMGMSTAELDKFMQDGKLIAEDFLPKFAQAMHDKFGKAAADSADSAAAGMNRFKNALEELKAEAAKKSGAMDLAGGAMQYLVADMKSIKALIDDIDSQNYTGGFFNAISNDAQAAAKVMKFFWNAATADDGKKQYYKTAAGIGTSVADFEQVNVDATTQSFQKLETQLEKVRGELGKLYKEKKKLADDDFYSLTADQRSNSNYKPELETAADYEQRLKQLKGDDKNLTSDIVGLERERVELLKQMDAVDLSDPGAMDFYIQARDRLAEIDNSLLIWQEQLQKVRAELDTVAEGRTAKIDADISAAEKKVAELENQYWQLSRDIPLNVDNYQALSAIQAVKEKLLELQALRQMMYTINILGAMSPALPFTQAFDNLLNKLSSIPGGQQYQIDFLMNKGGMDAQGAIDFSQQYAGLQKLQSQLDQAYQDLQYYKQHTYSGYAMPSTGPMADYYEQTVIPNLINQIQGANLALMSSAAGSMGRGGGSMATTSGGGGSAGGGGVSINVNTININAGATGSARDDARTMAIELDQTFADLIKSNRSKIPGAMAGANQ
jgi:tape measure domain-containing protein